MLTLNILKPVVIVGREYTAGDSVEVHKTLIHHEVKKVSDGIQALLTAGAIEEVTEDSYKILSDIVVNVVGLEYRKDDTFTCSKVYDYIDEVDYPVWVGRGAMDGLWTLDDGTIHVASATVSDPTVALEVGATKQLTSTVLPANATDKTGVWESSAPAVATVSSTGLVTAVGAGTANIRFVTTDGAKEGVSVATVTVSPASVTMSDASVTIEVGETKQLTATVLPANATDKTGVWDSSNPAVATVSSTGLLTGVSAGAASITFRTTVGNKPGMTLVTVNAAVIVPTSVSVTPASPTTTVGGTVKLSAAITPANSTDKTGVWASATPAVATVDADGTVHGVAEGTSIVSFTTNSGARTANRTVTITAA